ncbi:M14 family zinc carboxypeptidase [Kordiimonas sp.]|uniref:M14 family zinc carboxypeptidase n=1 Tax=Kordiimonas sp. TaxID=1970157 RepID=UPI003B52A5C2
MRARLLKLAAALGMGAMAFAVPVKAEPLDYFLVPGVEYDQGIVKPEEVFGHGVGDQPVRHDLMVSYMREVVEQSPRMTVETIGYSHERRPILFITVSSPENLARIDEIRANHIKRSNPATADQASDDLPVVTWLNYGVHGAESSGMDAAIPALYHLAAAQVPEMEETLENSVILITAVFNPDGHARRGAWVTQYGSDIRALDPAHEVHNQVWPGGRTNHYWFDLNRQWLLQTQPESQAWLAKWHEWKPEVSGDFHEMGGNSTYYFHPGVPTRKHPLIPAKGRELLVEIANYHRATLDKAGTLYFSEEGFDNYYVGKGSTYPQINGSLGILYEAGAQMGIARESDQGIKTYADNVLKHFRTSLSTIKGAAAMRTKLHAYQREFYANVAGFVKDDDVKGYVFQAPEDPVRLNMFLTFLSRHRVAAYKLEGDVKAEGRTFGAGAYIVPMDQPQYRMAKALFGKITEFPDKVFYDVSGWTLPAAYGLDYAAVTGSLRGKLGAVADGSEKRSLVSPGEAPYAYVFRWSDYYAPRAVARLLDAGVMARVAKEPIEVQTTRGVVKFGRGAVIVANDLQTVPRASIHAMMQQMTEEDGIEVFAATSGHTLNVGADLGGRNSVADLKPVKPLLVVGGRLSSYDAGEVWHLLDHKMKMPVTLVREDRLSGINLNRYTHLILVGGRSGLPKGMVDDVKAWVKAGGTVVASRQGAKWAAENLTADKDDKKKDDKDNKTPERLSYAQKGQKDAEDVIGGAVFESDLDITHPLGFGLVRRSMATNKNTTFVLPVPKDPYAQVAVYTDSPLISGYSSDRRLNELKGTPMLTAERMGDGAVILFADDPNFRATYLGSERLFLNALFLSAAFDRSYADDEADEQAEEMEE